MPPYALTTRLLALFLSTLAAVAEAQTARAPVEWTTLDRLREAGMISQAEYEAALSDLGPTTGWQTGKGPTLLVGRWSTTLYGFIEADHIYDSTQSFNEVAGNGAVARTDSYAGRHSRLMFGVRNSRLGLRLRAPEFHRVRASAQLEMDFLGTQPPNAGEAALFTSPGFRLRHALLRLETPILDVLVGQTWQLFGWQASYHPNTVEIQGVPGGLYGRTPQLRLSRRLRAGRVTLEAALAIVRPPQRDSGYPEGQAGLRLTYEGWTGLATQGATGTGLQPLSIAISGDLRRFSLPEPTTAPRHRVDSPVGWGVAVDALIPLVPAQPWRRGNALTLVAEYAYGFGTADLYTNLSGGLVAPGGSAPPVDPALVIYGSDGRLRLIQWQSYLIGVQYYLPGLQGLAWVSANYAHLGSNNAQQQGEASTVRTAADWFDVNLFGDLTPAVRLGLEYAFFRSRYSDGDTPVNHRVQLSAFYLF